MSLSLERQLIILGEQDGRNVSEFLKPRATIQYKHHIRDEIEFERSNVAQLPFQLSAICITVLRFGIFNASYIGDDQARLKFRRDCKGLKYFRRYLIIQQIPLKGSRKRSLTSAMNAPKWIFFFCFRRATFKSIFG